MRTTGNYSRVGGVRCVAGVRDKVKSMDLNGLKQMVNDGYRRLREARAITSESRVRRIVKAKDADCVAMGSTGKPGLQVQRENGGAS